MSKVETYLTPDGRRAELREEVTQGDNGEERIVQETFEEAKLPKILKKRVIETKRPVVVEREIQEIENDTVVKTERESLNPDVKLTLREVVTYKDSPEKEPTVQELVKEAVQEAVEEQATKLLEAARANEKNVPVRPLYQALVADNVETQKKANLWNVFGVLVILAQAAAVAYLLMF